MLGEIPQYATPKSGKPISTRMQKYQSIRVRIKDDSSAILTLKSRSSKLRRREFEYAIPTLDAEELMSLRRNYIIEKVRHIVPYGNLNWEVDVFSGENQGLIVAEKTKLDLRTLRPPSATNNNWYRLKGPAHQV